MDSRSELPANTVLDGSYRIERVIGSGALGITYEAEDVKLATRVAIKEYFPFEFADRDATMSVKPKSERHKRTFDRGRSNFLQEARILGRFQHPNIVHVTGLFEANSTAYMVMRLEQGQTLEAWLNSLGRPPTQNELDSIVAPLLDALQVMHAANFLHRDIGPDNIIVRDDGTPVLLDFGAARRPDAEMNKTMIGTIKAGYSPHEQYSTDSRLQGPWSDIYALGATLYRAVTGHPPEEATLRVDGDGLRPAAQADVKGQYRPDFLSGIDACLQVRHADRPRSAAQARELLLGRGSHPSRATERTMGGPSKVGDPPASSPRSTQGVGNAVIGAAKLIVAVPVLVVGAAGAAVIGTAKFARKMLARQTQREADASPPSAPPISVASGPTMPDCPPSDVVQCSVFAPPKAAPATAVLVQVFLHAPTQAAHVETIARAFDDTSSKRQFATLPVPLKRGARVDISLVPSGLKVEEPHQMIIWRGESEAANFMMKVPADAGSKVFFPIVLVSVDGVPHGRLIFKLSSEVGVRRGLGEALGQHAIPYRRAFCSYSSENAVEVARCVQILNVLGYDCFHDKSTLKPGQNFEEALWNEVRQRELFLLFWSYAAQRSDWVRKEAQWAVEAQTQSLTQVPDILPIILDGPPPPSPYEFLSDRHFDDRFQYMIAALKPR